MRGYRRRLVAALAARPYAKSLAPTAYRAGLNAGRLEAAALIEKSALNGTYASDELRALAVGFARVIALSLRLQAEAEPAVRTEE